MLRFLTLARMITRDSVPPCIPVLLLLLACHLPSVFALRGHHRAILPIAHLDNNVGRPPRSEILDSDSKESSLRNMDRKEAVENGIWRLFTSIPERVDATIKLQMLQWKHEAFLRTRTASSVRRKMIQAPLSRTRRRRRVRPFASTVTPTAVSMGMETYISSQDVYGNQSANFPGGQVGRHEECVVPKAGCFESRG